MNKTIIPERKKYHIVKSDPPKCYADGTRGIPCSLDLLSFSAKRKGSKKWKHRAGWICSKHYDILAKMQNKPTYEQRQQKRLANTITDEDSAIIPSNKDWWNTVFLPSYRDEGMMTMTMMMKT